MKPKQEKKEPKGIGGWLLFPILGMLINIGYNSFYLLVNLNYGLEAYLYIFANLIFIILSITALFCAFKKLKIAKTIFILTYLITSLYLLLVFAIPEAFIHGAWIFYFIYSKRVKNTFTK